MTEFKPFRRANGDMIVDVAINPITDREYFTVRAGVDELRKTDPTQHRALMDAAKSKKPEALNKIYGEILEKHPDIHARMIGQNAGEIVEHIASGKPVRPMLEVNGRPFSARIIESEIAASIRESSAGSGRHSTHLDDVRQNTIRLTGAGKVEGAFHVDAEKAATLLGAKHVQITNDGQSAKIDPRSMLSKHPASHVAAADAQVLSSVLHDAKKAVGNNLILKALMAGGAMVTAGAAAAAEAPEGQRLEAGGKAAIQAGAEYVVPGITETDKCVAQGKAWGNVGAGLGGAGVTAGVVYLTGGIGLLAGTATTALGAYTGDKIGSALGEGVCRMAQSATGSIAPDNIAMMKHTPNIAVDASSKVPDPVGAKTASTLGREGRG